MLKKLATRRKNTKAKFWKWFSFVVREEASFKNIFQGMTKLLQEWFRQKIKYNNQKQKKKTGNTKKYVPKLWRA